MLRFAFICAAFVFLTAPVLAQDAAPLLTIQQAFIRATPSTTTAGYMAIINASNQDDVLVSASADWAERVELHNVEKNDQGIMKMFQVKSITIPAQSQIALTPGGLHLMIFGVKDTLNEGDIKPITLSFQNGTRMKQDFTVMPISYQGDDMQHNNHSAHHHD